METKFWYGLKSEVYVRLCSDRALAYDTKQKICRISEDRHVIHLLRTAEEDESLGCVLIDMNWQFPSVKEWIQSTCKDGMAVAFPYFKDKEHPVILRPLLSLNKDVNKISDENIMSSFWGGDIKHFLNSLTVFVNNNCTSGCMMCKNYFKQIPFCTNYGTSNDSSITSHQLTSILTEVSDFPISHINIFGGDIYDERLLSILESAVKRDTLHFRFYTHYKKYKKNAFVDSQEVHILIPSRFDSIYLMSVCKHMGATEKILHFVVENDDDVQVVEDFIDKNDIVLYQMYPFYTGVNEPFFRKNVYMSKKELMNSEISMREIFRNQKLNANNFGSLYIMPDGSIKAHMNGQTLGYVGKNELLDIIYKEIVINTAWRKVRDKEPCSQCVFQNLCPPTSSYETAIGRDNLCDVYNKTIVSS